jgi:hypothetical protein
VCGYYYDWLRTPPFNVLKKTKPCIINQLFLQTCSILKSSEPLIAWGMEL